MKTGERVREGGDGAYGRRAWLRVIGAALLLLVVLPFHALAPPGLPGSPAEHLRTLARSYHGALVFGAVGIAVVCLPLGFTRLPRRMGDALERTIGRWLAAPGSRAYAIVLASLSGLMTSLVSAYAFSLRPALLDASSQLVQARYLAAGRLAGPELAVPEFFIFQFMVNLPSGWASQYPPGHIALLAAGFAAGAPGLVGPLLVALTVYFVARAAEEILPDDVLAARLGTAFLALSLFFLGHAASYMNHATAAAFGALAVLGGLRGGGGSRWARAWVAVAGIATGVVFATRPVAGLVTGAVALGGLHLAYGRQRGGPGARGWLPRVVYFALGGLPPLILLAYYNQRLFGGPARFGYLAAEGPGHGMGFHRDPWGNLFGPLDGLARTSRDLLALGLDLLLTPLSAVLIVGLYLLAGPTRPRALPLLLGWALLPVVAHFFYWHQDLFMGPRLLTEFTPPWALLSAVAVLEVLRRSRSRDREPGRRFDPHGAVVGALLLSGVAAGVALIPQRLAFYHSQWGPGARAPIPGMDAPALVFVQSSWTDRLGARLSARGLRVDSVRSALRYNTSCEVQTYLDHSSPGRGAVPGIRLHFEPRPGIRIAQVSLDPTVKVWTHAAERPTPECIRQASADRRGALELPDLLWQGDLPGLPERGPMYVRDLGPELNPRLMELYPARRSFVYLRREPHLRPELLPYAEAMNLLWRTPVAGADGAGGSEGATPEP